MRNLKLILASVVVFISLGTSAQQLNLSNLYTQNHYMVNPANAGDHGYAVAHLLHRQQWTNISGAPVSSMFSVHSPLGEKNAVGGFVSADRAGLLERFSASGTYVYRAKINDDHILSFGLSLGFYQNRINYESVRIRDASDDILLNGGAITGSAFNADFGIRYNFKGLEIGISTPQIAETKVQYSLLNDEQGQFDLVRHYSALASYKIDIKEDFSVKPVVFLRYAPNAPVSFDASATVNWKEKLWIGGGYRAKAGIIAFAGAKIAQYLSAGYSYEFSGSGIASYSGGSHEIIIGYHFNKGKDEDDKIKALEEKFNARFEEQDRKIDSLMNLIDEHNREIQSLKTRMDDSEAKQAASQKRIEELEGKVDELNEQLKNVEIGATSTPANETIEDKYGLSDDERNALKRHIKFDLNGAYALDESKPDLKLIAGIIKKHPSLILSIEGHTCDRGDEAKNMKLSKSRAAQVANYFYGKGVDAKQVKTSGFGSTQPLVPNDSEENRIKNRRVIFEIIEE